MTHKVVITKDENTINGYLDDGWKVKSVTAQRIEYSTGSNFSHTERSNFCFVLKKKDF
jgi:hypothetical protein